MKAAVLALVANTAPVAFGAMATPIITLGKVTELPVDTLGAMVGRQTPILALLVPLALVAIVDGRRGMRETWPAAVVCGVVFAIAQYATSNFLSVPLADVVASLRVGRGRRRAGAGLAAPLVVHRGARRGRRGSAADAADRAATGTDADDDRPSPPRASTTRRTTTTPGPTSSGRTRPTGSSSAVFVICQIPAVKSLLDKATFAFNWPGLDVVDADGDPLSLTKFTPQPAHHARARRCSSQAS